MSAVACLSVDCHIIIYEAIVPRYGNHLTITDIIESCKEGRFMILIHHKTALFAAVLI